MDESDSRRSNRKKKKPPAFPKLTLISGIKKKKPLTGAERQAKYLAKIKEDKERFNE